MEGAKFDKRYKDLIDQIRTVQSELEKTLQAIYGIDGEIADLEDLKETLISIQKIGKGKQTLIAIGNALLKMQIEDAEKIFLDIGGGILVETKIEDALKQIDDKIKELFSLRTELLSKAAHLRSQLEELIAKVRELGKEEGKQ